VDDDGLLVVLPVLGEVQAAEILVVAVDRKAKARSASSSDW
jgi:hypothetical protein